MFCKNCGNEIKNPDQTFCTLCGRDIQPNSISQSKIEGYHTIKLVRTASMLKDLRTLDYIQKKKEEV